MHTFMHLRTCICTLVYYYQKYLYLKQLTEFYLSFLSSGNKDFIALLLLLLS